MDRICNRIGQGINLLTAIILNIMIVLVFTNVVLRYGFSSGLREVVELSRLGLVWVVILGAVMVLQRRAHLAVTEFSEHFMPRWVPLLDRLCWLVILCCSAMLCIGSYEQTLNNWRDLSPLTGLPSGLFYLPGVLSGGLMALIALLRLIVPHKN
ncbi:MAG: TRAP transporter small permease [Enterobacteriaceae bacterium]